MPRTTRARALSLYICTHTHIRPYKCTRFFQRRNHVTQGYLGRVSICTYIYIYMYVHIYTHTYINTHIYPPLPKEESRCARISRAKIFEALALQICPRDWQRISKVRKLSHEVNGALILYIKFISGLTFANLYLQKPSALPQPITCFRSEQ